MAWWVRELSDPHKSKELLIAAEKVHITHGSIDDALVATMCFHLGRVYRATHEIARSMQYQTRSHEIRLRPLGLNHDDTLSLLTEIGAVRFSRSKVREALADYQYVLDKRLKCLLRSQPSVVCVLSKIGIALRSLRQYDEVLRIHQQEVLDMRLKQYGERHSYVAQVYNNVAVDLQCLGRL